jgi:hypothetical protein
MLPITPSFKNICNGDIEELQKIPKLHITDDIYNLLIFTMEENIQNIILSISKNTDDVKYIAYYLLEKKMNIEKCIAYLKKIK